jgi:hypothetical protein
MSEYTDIPMAAEDRYALERNVENPNWVKIAPLCRVLLEMPEADIMWLREKIQKNLSQGKNYIEVVDESDKTDGASSVEMHIIEVLIRA